VAESPGVAWAATEFEMQFRKFGFQLCDSQPVDLSSLGQLSKPRRMIRNLFNTNFRRFVTGCLLPMD
jgi:hypothetical protein